MRISRYGSTIWVNLDKDDKMVAHDALEGAYAYCKIQASSAPTDGCVWLQGRPEVLLRLAETIIETVNEWGWGRPRHAEPDAQRVEAN